MTHIFSTVQEYIELKKKYRRVFFLSLVLAFVSIIAIFKNVQNSVQAGHEDNVLKFCKQSTIRPHYSPDNKRINERNVLFNHDSFLLSNATIIDGDGIILKDMDLLVKNSTIVRLGKKLLLTESYSKFFDLNGSFVSPGLVDIHSHFGTRVQPQLKATEDTNEFLGPITPYMRAIDGLDPQDPELDSLVASGVTSHLVLTGSRNLLSGESYAIKMHRSPNNLVDELLIQYNANIGEDNKPVRWFKMAYGENQKSSHAPGYPVSRMGEAWDLRKAFQQGQALVQKQDEWCRNPQLQKSDYPRDVELDNVAAILRGDFKINVHVYETYDIESLLRIADEFGFHIASFHHALSSWKVLELLKNHNSSVAIFADEWGKKKEMSEGTVYAPKILSDYGIPVSIKTDHPALPGQDLLYYAQIAHNFGLAPGKAISAITSVPALTMGMGHRIGYIREGYDADLVIWDNHPLVLGAKAKEVLVDGIPAFNFTKIDGKYKQELPKQRKVTTPERCPNGNSFIILGLTNRIRDKLFDQSKSLKIGNSEDGQYVAVIANNELICLGGSEFCQLENFKHYPTVHLNGGYILPAVTGISQSIGLQEMPNESDTSDGSIPDAIGDLPHSVYGVSLDSLMIERLRDCGISMAITAPLGDQFLKGVSTRFALGARTLDEAIIDDAVAIHFTIGNSAKSDLTPSISSQIQKLKQILSSLDPEYTNLPIAIHTHNKGVIRQIIRLKKELNNKKIIIIGGQEAYLIADELAAAEIPVVLAPWRCTAKFWENRLCSPNEPLLKESSISILHKAGVKFALGTDDDNSTRRLFWEAGLAAKSVSDFSEDETIALLTSNVNEIFSLQPANDFVIFEGNPFDFGAQVAFTFNDGKVRKCFPDFEEQKKGDLLFSPQN